MNNNKRKKHNLILILCVVLSFLFVALTTIIGRNQKLLVSETSSESEVSFDSSGAYDELPHQAHFISAWDRCLDQLRIDSDVVFLGDSITYKSSFEQQFPDLVICNLGVCSDTIKAMNMRVGTLETLKPEKVFLMIGINSLRTNDLDECIEDYKDLVNNILSRWDFDLYIMSVTPVAKDDLGADNASPEVIASFNEAIKEIAAEKDATYVDLYSELEESGYIKPEFTSDGLHLSDEAYEVWAELIEPYLD